MAMSPVGAAASSAVLRKVGAAAASAVPRKDPTSIQNPLIKELFRLRAGRARARARKGLALVRGRNVITSIGEFFPFKHVFTTEGPEALGKYNAQQVFRVDRKLLHHAIFPERYEAARYADKLDDDDLVLGTIEQPSASDFAQGVPELEGGFRPLRRLLALDGVKHPENMGMLLNSAVALQYDGVFLTGPCIDPFNFKVLETSQGSAWTMPYSFGSSADLLALCSKHRLAMHVASTPKACSSPGGGSTGVPIDELQDLDTARYNGYCLVVGNEAMGASEALVQKSTKLTLPMSELVDSLNAGVAGGILMHALACSWPRVV